VECGIRVCEYLLVQGLDLLDVVDGAVAAEACGRNIHTLIPVREGPFKVVRIIKVAIRLDDGEYRILVHHFDVLAVVESVASILFVVVLRLDGDCGGAIIIAAAEGEFMYTWGDDRYIGVSEGAYDPVHS
jgi:hypothetical protein